MNKDASDFMIQEYDRISTAYFGLRDQVNDWFKMYVTLIGLPITVLVGALKLLDDGGQLSVSDLPGAVAGVLVLIALLGLFVTLSVVAMRMEMILYARTINGVRRYFGELDQKSPPQALPVRLVDYLVLPTSDAVPPFFETWRAMFWQVAFLGFADGVIMAVGVHSLGHLHWWVSLVVGAVYATFHLAAYYWLASRRKKGWIVRFPASLRPSQS